jgi:DNA-binding MarR family transcriptional regulator
VIGAQFSVQLWPKVLALAARKNIVALTKAGRKTLTEGSDIVDAAEREFLAPLSQQDATRFRQMLQALTLANQFD